MKAYCLFGGAILVLLAARGARAGESGPAGDGPKPPAAPGEWQKLETKLVPLADPRLVLSPGLFDPELQHVITFPKDGSAVDLDLPHEGKDAAGKPHPPLLAKFSQNMIWVDGNGDGKAGANEVHPARLDGYSEPFTCDLHYGDGTTAAYTFRFKTIVEREKFALIRCAARVATFQGTRLALLDDSGTGNYNDLGKDALQVGEDPVSLLGKYVRIDGKFYELLVHTAGMTLEIRAVPDLELAYVDMFKNYQPSQESETLRIHTLIVSGGNGSFSFDAKHRGGPVPAGAYDLAFGLFERAKELVYLKNGDNTSFTVQAKETAAPKWGGTVTAKFDVDSDGQTVTVAPPLFTGKNSERYFPENFRVIPVTVGISQVWTDRMRIEHIQGFGQKRFEVLPDGNLKSVVFKPFRFANDTYEVGIEYNSGIMGKVLGRQRLEFVYRKKP